MKFVVDPGFTSPLVGLFVIETIDFDDGKKSEQLVRRASANSVQKSTAEPDFAFNFMRECGSSLGYRGRFASAAESDLILDVEHR